MSSQRSLYRVLLLIWLVLVLGMGFVLHMNTKSQNPGSLFAFLFTSPQNPQALPPVVVAPQPMPIPAPVVAKEEAKPKPEASWVPLQRGKKPGKGALTKPQVTTLANGDVEVRFTCPDAPGNYRQFHPVNIDSLAIDLMGPWGKGLLFDKRPDKGVLKRVQMADHREWVRVTGIARNTSDTLTARVEYAPTLRSLRVIFTREQ